MSSKKYEKNRKETNEEKKAEIISLSLPQTLIDQIDNIQNDIGFSSRSEVIRNAIRSYISELRAEEVIDGLLEGAIITSYNLKAGAGLSEIKHNQLPLIRAFLHSHFANTDKCLEILVVSGPNEKIKNLIKAIKSQKGVELVKFTLIP
ncbi:MAG: CopG family ribbon-helix-helix protein [Candidatus Wukongarchaeota archaeon]|nr:CopG family ribbon-helix-helix protein [Candidatus Wukongarchaeota archaeon]